MSKEPKSDSIFPRETPFLELPSRLRSAATEAAYIESGRVVPVEPLPEESQVRRVTILVEMEELPTARPDSALPRLLGILKTDVANPRQEYRTYLKEKYL